MKTSILAGALAASILLGATPAVFACEREHERWCGDACDDRDWVDDDWVDSDPYDRYRGYGPGHHEGLIDGILGSALGIAPVVFVGAGDAGVHVGNDGIRAGAGDAGVRIGSGGIRAGAGRSGVSIGPGGIFVGAGR